MELVFGKLQKFRKKKSLVNDEEFQVRYECWFWFDRGWNRLKWLNWPIKNRNHQH